MKNSSPWTFRGYLPHLNASTRSQFITYRLADSLPKAVIERVNRQLEQLSGDSYTRKRMTLLEKYADKGLGSCVLKERRNAHIVIENLNYFNGVRYTLKEWVVMPNHVHILIKPLSPWTLDKISHGWKSYTGTRINRQLSNPLHPIWQREIWDRYVRDENHAKRIVHYIRMNPVKAGLCSRPEDWPFGSAGCQFTKPSAWPVVN